MKTNKQSSHKVYKSQYWASIIYPNSRITIEYLDRVVLGLHLPCVISPLHNRDSKDGYPIRSGLKGENVIDEWKKSHYHIMFMFPRAVGLCSFEYIKDKLYFDYEIELVGHENIFDGPAMARYFCHLDNPEKQQYNKDDMLWYCGLSPDMLITYKKNPVEEKKIRRKVIRDIIFYQLCDLVEVEEHFFDDDILLDYAETHTSMIEKYCRANFYKYRRAPTTTKSTHMLTVN